MQVASLFVHLIYSQKNVHSLVFLHSIQMNLNLVNTQELEDRVLDAFKDENHYNQVQRAKFKSVEQHMDYSRFSQVSHLNLFFFDCFADIVF